MAADEKVLGALHTAVAQVLTDALKGQKMPDYVDPDTGDVVEGMALPPSAAIIAAATKFLKDNNITCAPSEDNAIGELQRQMQERRNKRATRSDLTAASDDMRFLSGLPMEGNA